MVIETHALTKRYGTKTACSDISISVKMGEIYGFLGPNGAGKSTAIKMLTGLIFPTSGEGAVLGRPLGDVLARRKMGYLPENFRYQSWMTGEDLLEFHSRLFRLPKSRERIEEVLKLVEMQDQGKVKVGAYSKGMQQRIGLACALLPRPELLFLDEPTSALDPIGRKEVRDIIQQLKQDGTTVFLNSHLLAEVEAVCDSVSIISRGVVVRSDSMKDLLEERMSLRVVTEGMTQEVLSGLRERFDRELVEQADGAYILKVGKPEAVPEVAAFIVGGGVRLHELTPQRETLESVFMRIVGEGTAPS